MKGNKGIKIQLNSLYDKFRIKLYASPKMDMWIFDDETMRKFDILFDYEMRSVEMFSTNYILKDNNETNIKMRYIVIGLLAIMFLGILIIISKKIL